MIVRRFSALLAGEGAARVIGFVIVLLLARRLGPAGFGIVTFGLTLVGWFSLRRRLGHGDPQRARGRAAARPLQAHRRARARPAARAVRLAAVLFVGGVLLFARSDLTRSTLVLFALILPATALNLRWMVLGVGGSRAIALGQVLSRAGRARRRRPVRRGLADLKRVPVLEAVAALVYALVILWLVGGGVRVAAASRGPRRVGVDAEAEPAADGQRLRPLGVVSFDILLIDLALGPRDVGIYGVASKPAFFVDGRRRAVLAGVPLRVQRDGARGRRRAARDARCGGRSLLSVARRGRRLSSRRSLHPVRVRRRATRAPFPCSRCSPGGSRSPCSPASTAACSSRATGRSTLMRNSIVVAIVRRRRRPRRRARLRPDRRGGRQRRRRRARVPPQSRAASAASPRISTAAPRARRRSAGR